VLQDDKYSPELRVNLFSINNALNNGFKTMNDGIIIHLSKRSTIISFDSVLNAEHDFVSGAKFNPISIESRKI
jgi:hypothetical protein